MKKTPAGQKTVGNLEQTAPNEKRRTDNTSAQPLNPQGQPRVGHLSGPSENDTNRKGAGKRAKDNIHSIPAPPEPR
jgi:hypothetical protein